MNISIYLSQSGTLKSEISLLKNDISSLTLSGLLDARDFKTIRDEMNNLTTLNIDDVNIVEYLGKDGTCSSNKEILYKANSIPQFALNNCNISNIFIPDSIESIDNDAFARCNNLQKIYFGKNSILKYIGDNAFSLCRIITISFPKSLLKIGDRAFSHTPLSKIIFSSQKISFGKYVFNYCKNLTTIVIATKEPIPIEQNTFFEDDLYRFYQTELKSLFKKITLFVPFECLSSYQNSLFWGEINTILPIIEKKIDIKCKKQGYLNETLYKRFGKSYKSISNLKISGELDANDFKTLRDDLPILTELDISEVIIKKCFGNILNDVESDNNIYPENTIPKNAFFNSWNYGNKFMFSLLEYIILPNSITKIGSNAFTGSDLKLINIPRDVEVIESGAFENNINLYEINFEIDSSLKYIGLSSFLHTKIKQITIPKYVETIAGYSFCNCDILQNVCFEKDAIISKIGFKAFQNCQNIKQITLPTSVKIIEGEAFMGATRLEQVIFEDSSKIRIIEKSAFEKCNSLKTITIPGSIEELGESVFSDCTELNYIFISSPTFLKKIEKKTFHNCSKLRTFLVPSTVNEIGESAFLNCISLESISIPASIRTINNYLFDNCTNLQFIDLPDTIFKIGFSAFNNCTKIKEINLPASLMFIESTAFNNCSANIVVNKNNPYFSSFEGILFNKNKNILINFPTSFIGEYIIPDTVIKINDFAFSYCIHLIKVSIHKHVEYIGNNAFSNCSNLTSIIISSDSQIDSIKDGVFLKCKKLQIINIPDTVLYIGSHAFEDCYELNQITLPENIKSLWYSAFQCCKNLQYVNIPTSLIEIADQVFIGCENLNNINFSRNSSLVSIGDYAFSNISRTVLKDIPEKIRQLNEKAFEKYEWY